ncbi:MAG TPA: superoxide dismutase family protein [Casimicrobiaceae bacterium]
MIPLRKSFEIISRIVRALGTASILAACAPSGTGPPPIVGASAAPPAAGLVAPLRGLGSATSGKVRVIDRGDGITILVSGSNLPPNQFRVSFNQNGNCSSPNGYSAGPPWAPPGMDPYELIPLFWNPDGNAEGQAHIRGVHTTGENGVAGRSVVIYWGSKVTDAEPGVPNNRAACGVFEPVQTLLF